MSDLRDDARRLYERHAEPLGLDPWKAGAWRDEPPTPAQVRTLTRVAGTELVGLTEDDRQVVRSVAIAPKRAGRGACHDAQAVALTAYQHATGRDRARSGTDPPRRPGRVTARPRASEGVAFRRADPPTAARALPVEAVGDLVAERMRRELLRAILDADARTLARIAAVLWG